MLYRLDADADQIARTFAASAGDDPWKQGHVSPGMFAPAITAGREFVAGPRPDSAGGAPPRRIIPRLWGVPPPPSAGPARQGVASVRNLESPFWIGNLRNSEFRCLIPATSFIEWSRDKGPDGKRRRLTIRCADQPLFAFAGVWKDSEIPSFALLTCEASAALRAATARDSMPVILPPDPHAHRLWLTGDWKRAQSLIAPYSSSLTQID